MKALNSAGRAVRKAAFTLVETVLAIGIVSTVLIALVGLLPSGLDILVEAGQRTTGARVAQQMISEIQQAEWDDVPSFDSTKRYYDDMGNEVNSQSRATYIAKVEINTDPQYLPGGEETEHLRSVVVKVGNAVPTPNFADSQAGRDYLRYATTVVKLSQDTRN